MNVSRRSFVRASSLAGFAAALSASLPQFALGRQRAVRAPLAQLPQSVLNSPLYSLTRQTFEDQVGTNFTFSHSSINKVNLRLINVVDLHPTYGDGRPQWKECFSLLFQAPPETMLDQKTYTVRHFQLGQVKLFIVPRDEANQYGLTYEAHINRLYP